MLFNQNKESLLLKLMSGHCNIDRAASEEIKIPLNMSYLTVSYIGFTLKIESVSKNIIFGLKMTVKNGLEKYILKSHHEEG